MAPKKKTSFSIWHLKPDTPKKQEDSVRYYQVKGWSLSTSLVRITSKTDGFEK
jgi:hypothetical protein